MSDTKTEDVEQDREKAVAGLLPALAQLDQTATALELKASAGEEVTSADISAYQHQAAHAQHMVREAGADAKEVAAAEREHRGDGEKGFATRALDHAAHPRHFEPATGDEGAAHTRDDEEDIDL